jgi:hypothetical protein
LGKFRIIPQLALGIVVGTFLLLSCSSSHTVAVTLSPTTGQTVTAGQTVTITATVANDTNNEGVNWSLSGVGALTNSTTTSVTYKAPSPGIVVTNSTATVTATSIANTTATATLSITVNSVLTLLTTSLPSGTLGSSYDAFINAGGAIGPFTWNLTGSLPAGLTLQPSTNSSIVISGTPMALGTSDFTIRVSDAAGNSASQALSITINPPPPLSITTRFLPNGTVNAPYNQSLQAANGVQPYTWSLISGSLPANLTLNSSGVISGTPTATGTSSFTVQVTDSSTPNHQTATANLSISINGGSYNTELSSNYAFQVSGFDPNGLFLAAGSFVADGNGNISAGILDTNDPASLQTNQTFTGTYSIDSNNLGTMILNITSGGGGSRTFAFALTSANNGVSSGGSIIEFDDSTGNGTGTRNSGVLLKQDPSAFSTSQILGYYAFGLLGADSLANRFGMAGEFYADGAGNLTSGLLDSDDSSSGISSSVAWAGTYSVASDGRGTATITTTQSTTNYAFYVVSATQMLMIETDSAGNPLVGGSILQQADNGQFNDSSLNATSVFQTTALPTSSGTAEAQTQVGLYVTNGSGGSTLSSDLNTGGQLTSPVSQCTQLDPCTYAVASNGRVTLTNSGFQNSQPVLYLVVPNEAFIIGTDAAVTFGFMEAQSVPQQGFFSNASLSGTYAGGSIARVQPSISNEASAAAADGAGNLTFTTDISGVTGLYQNQPFAGTYSVAVNGRTVLTESGNEAAILYLLSGTQFFTLATGADQKIDLSQH